MLDDFMALAPIALVVVVAIVELKSDDATGA